MTSDSPSLGVDPPPIKLVSIRVSVHTRDFIAKLLKEINDKELGNEVRTDDLISAALQLVGKTQIVALRDATLSNSDRLELKFRAYKEKHGEISKDAFLGKLITNLES